MVHHSPEPEHHPAQSSAFPEPGPETMSISPPPRGADAVSPSVATVPGAALTIVRGPGVTPPVTIRLSSDTPVVIGRDRACDIVLEDVTVSRRHAEVRHTADGVIVTDLG